jgi:hypothetical protein
MSVEREARRLLRLYPLAWRERYGEELAEVIVCSSGDRIPWRVRADVVASGVRARLAGSGAPGERARGGVLLVLCAWALVVVAGLIVQRVSEHWSLPGDPAVPQAAFAALIVAAACGGVLVLAGIGLALPHLRRVRWTVVGPALALTLVALAATAGIAAWGSSLSPADRDGHDTTYAIAVVAWALLGTATLAAWTAAACTLAHDLDLRPALLRAEARLSVAVTTTIAVVTAATAIWWAEIGTRVWSTPLIAATALMALATALATTGAHRATQAVSALR